mgnify:CR=1 FL=1
MSGRASRRRNCVWGGASAVLPIGEVETSFYLRMLAHDEPGVMAEVSTTLAEAGISIEAMRQYESVTDDGYVPLVMLTHSVTERIMDETIAKIEALPRINGPVVRIRMEHLN